MILDNVRNYLAGASALLVLSTVASAQDNGRELLGMRLYNQSCRVCHTKPQPASQQYGPTLSRI